MTSKFAIWQVLATTFLRANALPLRKSQKKRETLCRILCNDTRPVFSPEQFAANNEIARSLPGSPPINLAYVTGKELGGTLGYLTALLGLMIPSLIFLRLVELPLLLTNHGRTTHLFFLGLRTIMMIAIFVFTLDLHWKDFCKPSIGVLVVLSLFSSLLFEQFSALWLVLTVALTLAFFALHRYQKVEGIATLLGWVYFVAIFDLRLFLGVFFVSSLSVTLFILI